MVLFCFALIPKAGIGQSEVVLVDPPNPTTSDSVVLSYVLVGNDLILDELTYSIADGNIDIEVKVTEPVFPHTTTIPISIAVGKLPAGSYLANLNYSYRNFFDTPYIRAGLLARAAFSVALAITSVAVVEFFHAGLNHYFISADRDEIEMLTANEGTLGWVKTGRQFDGFSQDAAPADTGMVCRFYGSTSPGPNSHFYTAFPEECAFLKQLQRVTPGDQARWNFESTAFSIRLPQDDQCAGLTPIPIYRVYNNRAAFNDANHRYTTNIDTYRSMVALGWRGEGIVMCAASAP